MEAYDIYPFISKDYLLLDNLYNDKGVLLLRKGMKLTQVHINIIQKHQLKRIEEVTLAKPALKNFRMIKEDYKKNISSVKEFFQTTVQDNPKSIQELLDSFSPFMQDVMNTSAIMPGIYSLKSFDEYTFRHSVNVGIICGLLGKILNYNDNAIIKLGEMGLLHDIGKMRIPLHILNKPGRLTKDEFDIIKKHPVHGYEMLKDIKGISQESALGALYHHEKLDGTGYPLNKVKEEIPFAVQILSVADTFDAICSQRVYSEERPPLYALDELLKDAFVNKLNPEIVIPFVRFVMEQQMNEEVVLSDDRIGRIVFFYDDEPSRPIIQLDNELLDLKFHREIYIKAMVVHDDEIEDAG